MRRRRREPADPGAEFRPAETVPTLRRRTRPGIPFGLIGVLVLAAGLWAFVTFVGLPAVLWEYRYTGSGDRRQDFACTYLRIDGEAYRAVPPASADRCPVIAFFRTR